MPDDEARCSFCLTPAPEVDQIIEGPGTHICDRCVRACVDILASAPRSRPDAEPQLPTWNELDDEHLLARLPRIAAVAAQVEGALHRWVDEARRRGLAWTRIGAALGMTRQSAWERFARDGGRRQGGAAVAVTAAPRGGALPRTAGTPRRYGQDSSGPAD
jgi:hypothetical protein